MYAFEEICRKHNLYLIGDAAQAIGTEYDGKGIANYGVVSSVSCQNSKNLSCGEGGLVLTNDGAVYERMMQMLNNGKDKNGGHVYLGLDNGMSDFQASILTTQFLALPGQITKRMENAAYLDQKLAGLDFLYTLKSDPLITRNSYHIYMFGLHEDKLQGVSRGAFLDAAAAEGLETICGGYTPAYTFPCMSDVYTRRCIGTTVNVTPDTPVAEIVSYHEGCWILHANLLGDREDMDDIIRILVKVYENIDELK